MKKSAMLDEICIRTGGDEFVVLAKNYNEQKEAAFTGLVREQIRAILKAAGKPYTFSVSIGCFRSVPKLRGIASIQSEAERYLGHADNAMYEEKRVVQEPRENG